MNIVDVVDKAKSLLVKAGQCELEVGKLIALARDQHGLKVPAMAARIGCSSRKATYLLAIYRKCEELNITKKDIAGIGWSRLKEVLPRITDQNKKLMLTHARSLSVRNVQIFAAGEESQYPVTAETFSLTRKQQKALHDALIRHGAKVYGRGLAGKVNALMSLVAAAA